MTKSRREQQLDRTRLWEWIYYVACAVAFGVAFALKASSAVMAALFAAVLIFGCLIWLVQYQVNDELGRLRIMKSWAVVGVVNMLALCGLVGWGALRLLSAEKNVSVEHLSVSFWLVYLLLVLDAFVLPGTVAYLKWQDERE